MIDLYIASCALTLILVGLLVFCVLNRRTATGANLTIREQALKIARLEQDLAALLACSRNIGARIVSVERTDRTLQQQIDKLEFTQDDGHLAVEHASKLLASGRSMNEVTSICELSEGEVEILQNLSSYRTAA